MARNSYEDEYGNQTGNYQATFWSYFILPYVEQNGLYADAPFIEYPNWTTGAYLMAAQQVLPVFRCPATTDALFYTTTANGTITNRFAASYALVASGEVGNPYYSNFGLYNTCPLYLDDGTWQAFGGFNGWGIYIDAPTTSPYGRDGAFGQNTMTKLTHVTDGTSNTAAAGERYRVMNNPAFYPENINEYGTWTMGTMLAENQVQTAYTSIGIPFNYNYTLTESSYDRFPASNTAGAFSSNHISHGINTLFLDGSVHFLASNTSDQVRAAIGSMAGGEEITIP
jgi:prepilin-type processing-associated H-X9-DG protein